MSWIEKIEKEPFKLPDVKPPDTMPPSGPTIERPTPDGEPVEPYEPSEAPEPVEPPEIEEGE